MWLFTPQTVTYENISAPRSQIGHKATTAEVQCLVQGHGGRFSNALDEQVSKMINYVLTLSSGNKKWQIITFTTADEPRTLWSGGISFCVSLWLFFGFLWSEMSNLFLLNVFAIILVFLWYFWVFFGSFFIHLMLLVFFQTLFSLNNIYLLTFPSIYSFTQWLSKSIFPWILSLIHSFSHIFMKKFCLVWGIF